MNAENKQESHEVSLLVSEDLRSPSPSLKQPSQSSPALMAASPVRAKTRRGKRAAPETVPAFQGNGKWTDAEHRKFLQALDMYGNCWKKVEEFVGTRSCAQIRSHCQKYFRRMRNKALQELKRRNQLKGKVFIVTKEYFNYSGCAHQGAEEDQQVPFESGSTSIKSEPVIKGSYSDALGEPKFENLEEPKNELNEAGPDLAFDLYDDMGLPSGANEVAFVDDYEERALPFLARVSYET